MPFCEDCNIIIDSKNIREHIQSKEHLNNRKEDDTDEDDEAEDLIIQRDHLESLEKHYKNMNENTFTANDYGPMIRQLQVIKEAKRNIYKLSVQHMISIGLKQHRDCKLCKCGTEFTTNENLILHQPYCSLTNNLECETCGNIFSDQYTLKRHKLKCNKPKQNIFKCEFCPKSYTTNGSLTRHLKKCKKKIFKDT